MSGLLAPAPGSDLLDARLGGRYAPAPEVLDGAHRRARVAQGMLVVHGLVLVGNLGWYALFPATDDTLVLVATSVVYLLTVVAFATWKVEAYRLAPALGGEPTERTPGWAAGGYFIPIGNLWIPYQIMKEIWDASDPRDVGMDTWAERSGTLLVVWWALWISSGFLTQILERLPVPAVASAGYQVFALVVWGLGVLVTGAAFLVIRRIDADQQRLGALLLNAETEGTLAESAPQAV